MDILDEAQLLEAAFTGDRSTWTAWHVLLAAAFGLPLDIAALEVLQRHTGRTVAPRGPGGSRSGPSSGGVAGRRG